MSDDANDWNSSSFPAAVVVEVNKPNCTRRAACLPAQESTHSLLWNKWQ